jgi:glycosyltransferase involved in cell wall biosynthesis
MFDSYHNKPSSTYLVEEGSDFILSKNSCININISESRSINVSLLGSCKFGDGKITVSFHFNSRVIKKEIRFSSKFDNKLVTLNYEVDFGSIKKISISKPYNSIGKVSISRIIMNCPKKEVIKSVKRRTNIGVLVPYSIYGGGEIYLKTLLQNINDDNYCFHILYPKQNKLSEVINGENIYNYNKFDLKNISNFAKDKEISSFIFYNSAHIYRLLLQLKKDLGIKIIEIYHSDFVWQDSMALIKNHEVDCMIKVDENVGNHISCKKVEICRVPIDSERFKPRSKDFAINTFSLSKDKNIGVISRISKEKNLEYILKLAKIMPEYSFFVVGDGVGRKDLEMKIRKNNILNLKILGWINDVSKIINGFDLILLPSKMEGTPISLLEAMSSNIQAWCYPVGGCKTLISNGAKELILEDEIDRMNIMYDYKNADNTRKYILENHSYKNISENFKNILDSVIYLDFEDSNSKSKTLGGFYV